MSTFDEIVADVDISEYEVRKSIMADTLAESMRRFSEAMEPVLREMDESFAKLGRMLGPVCPTCGWCRFYGPHEHVARMARGELNRATYVAGQETP